MLSDMRSGTEPPPSVPGALPCCLWFTTQEATLDTLDLQGSFLSPKVPLPFWKVFFLVRMPLSNLPHISCGQHLDLIEMHVHI